MPDNVGGRYSVLTAVGLLPIAVAGVDHRRADGRRAGDDGRSARSATTSNPAWQYAAMRHEL